MTKLNVCDLEVGDLARVVRPGQELAEGVKVFVTRVSKNLVWTRALAGDFARTWNRADGTPHSSDTHGYKLRTWEAP